jgi:predicted RNase H-like HicB family nuclease
LKNPYESRLDSSQDRGRDGLALKLRDIKTEVMREKDGSYAVVCSALGVYSVGKTLRDAKRNFEEALDLHLSVLREKATKQIATIAPEC